MSESPVYREWERACSLEETPFVRVIRDPYKRTVSSFHSAIRRPEICRAAMSGYFGRAITDSDGLSFNEFLSFLEATDVSKCNMHIREQFNPIEDRVRPARTINADVQDLYAGLNAFEDLVGLPRSDFSAGPLREAIDDVQRHHVTRRFDPGEDYSNVRLGRHAVRGRWPSYESLLSTDARRRIERIYHRDFAAYRDVLA